MRKTYSDEQLAEALQRSTSFRQVLRQLGLAEAGGNYASVQKHIALLKLDVSHLVGRSWRRGNKTPVVPPKSLPEITTGNSTFQSFKLKRRLFTSEIKEAKCERCGLKEWQGESIALELHHIDGNSKNNMLGNLQILCPNCHAMTWSYRGKNKGKV